MRSYENQHLTSPCGPTVHSAFGDENRLSMRHKFTPESYGTALANYSSSNSRKSLIRSNGFALRLPI